LATYYRVYDSRHLQADSQEPGSAPEPYARQLSMGYLYLFYRPKGVGVVPLKCPFAMGNPGSHLIHGSLNSRSIGSASNAGHTIVTNTDTPCHAICSRDVKTVYFSEPVTGLPKPVFYRLPKDL